MHQRLAGHGVGDQHLPHRVVACPEEAERERVHVQVPHLLEVEEEEQREAEDQQRYEGLIDHEQALAVDPVRSMALGELPGRRVLRLLIRELALALVQGILLGVVVGAAAYAWKGDPTLGIILAAAMVGNMIIAGLTGAGIPLLLRKLKMDPAVSAAVFITTFTDVLGPARRMWVYIYREQ